MNRLLLAGMATLLCGSVNADILKVDQFLHYGPAPLPAPLMVDTTDVNGKPFNHSVPLAAPERLNLKGNGSLIEDVVFAPGAENAALHTLVFNFENPAYTTAQIKVKGLKDAVYYVDGKKTSGSDMALRPGTHTIALRYVSLPDIADSLSVSLETPDGKPLALRNDGMRRFSLMDVLHGTTSYYVSLSPDGRYAIIPYQTTLPGGKTLWRYNVRSLADGRNIWSGTERVQWMPQGSSWYTERQGVNGREIWATDAVSGVSHLVTSDIPAGVSFTFTPDGKSAIITHTAIGPKEDPDVYRVIQPEDRQPGWRNRSSLTILDLESGVERPLTFGHTNLWLNDISDDSKKILIGTSRSRLEKRPTTVSSLYVMDLETMKTDTVFSDEGFVANAIFSPDASQVVVSGTPEAFQGIGLNLPEGRIPSMIENELYLIDLATGTRKSLTRDFDPSVASFKWSRADGKIWLTAEDRDCKNLFRLDPASGNITSVNVPEDNISEISTARQGRTLLLKGESASKPTSIYTLDTKTLRPSLIDTPKADMLADVKLGECLPWDFVNSRGDTICGRFYLPPDFDPSKKYPLIVNYYGGCSPTTRSFESRYPHNAYASQGYVVYVVQPSGATGFGQEFASRHVNTAGEGVAQDIIEGTKKFCSEHPWIDDKKIGCIGASYGGFMTQYLQTVTDIFAAAISHAGISDHTSYWGEGYWGYSYSEVSMADSYPWSETELYVKQSPLYNADKIHTPILFLHGDADMNVPVGESIQMFTALKLLGRPTEFVAVADQDHHILDYDKRIKWQDTIDAWFAKWLKDDATWWDALYPPTPLE